MAISKIILNGTTQIDLTQDTIDETTTLSGETGHKNDGTTFEGEIDTVTQATPTISVSSGGLITASATQTAGMVAAGTKSATQQLTIMSLPSSASLSDDGAEVASIFPSTQNTTYINIPVGYNDAAQYYRLRALMLDSKSIAVNGTYNASSDDLDGFSSVTVNVPSGGANFGTVTTTNSNNQAQSIDFTIPSGRTVKAFFARLTTQIARSSSYRYYYVFDMRWDGSSTGGVEGNQFYMYNGTLSNVTSGYSRSQSGTTFTLSTTGTRSASPGSFYNGTYELVYVY